MWATSLPPEHTGTSGCGNSWIPLTAIKCGTQEITCIEVSEENNVVAVGDSSGNVSLWKIPDAANSGFKRVFTALLDSRVTSLSFSGVSTNLVAGTDDGSLYDSKDWSKSVMSKIESLDHIGASGSVIKTLVAPYWNGTAYTYAIYVIFKSGHYGVVDANSHQMLSFCSSGSNPIDLSEDDAASDDEDGSHDRVSDVDRNRLVYACVMNEKFEIITAIPDLSKEDTPEVEEIVPVQEVTSTHTTPEPKKSFGFFKKGNTPPPSALITPPREGSSARGMSASPFVIPATAPRFLVYLRGRYLVTCDLQKFGLPSISEKSSAIVFSAALPHAVTMKCISEGNDDGPFVAAQDINIIEDSTRFWSQPIPCISTLDCEGNLKILSIPSGELISTSPVLPDVFSEEFNIKSSTILPNGNTYLSTSSHMIYSSTPENKAYPQTASVPCRAAPGFTVPPQSQMLHVTIGDKDAAAHIKTKAEKKDKRRGSVMSFALSGPVDFQKLFSKSLDSRRKDELFGASNSFNEEDEDDVVSSAQVRSTQSKAAGTKAVLDETRQAFEERGERLNRLTKKMEDFGEGAKIYKKQSAAHKEKMRKKAERWGAF